MTTLPTRNRGHHVCGDATVGVHGSRCAGGRRSYAGDTEAVRSLVRSGADVNTAQGDGLTALHWAGMKGDAEMAKILIYAGAALHAVTRNGAHTPLHVASKAGNVPVMRALLESRE